MPVRKSTWASSSPPSLQSLLAAAASISVVVFAGLVVVRGLVGGGLSHQALASDVSGEAVTYGFVALSSLLLVSALAWGLGAGWARAYALSLTDTLTGLYNRRHFAAQLISEMRRDRRLGQTTCVMCVDVDGLKVINDRHGHDQGDAALVEVAAVLSHGLRARDVVARFGGDEFAVLLPHTTGHEAVEIGGRILARVHERAASFPGGLSISIGVAELEASATPNELLVAADRALYWVKHTGGGRVSLAPRVVIGAASPARLDAR